MQRRSLRSLLGPLASLLSRLAARFHSTLSFDSPLSISCTLCNYFTALGYYPFNALLYALFASRSDGWQQCADLMRYQLGLLALFALYVMWRVTLSTAGRRARDGSLLALAALQLWLDWHGWAAANQAVTNFQAWIEADDEEWASGLHTAVDHATHSHTHQPVHPPPPSPIPAQYPAYPSYPYHLSEQCGAGFSIHLVRLVLVNVAFTAAVALAFVSRIGSDRVSEARKERLWAAWDGAVARLERQWGDWKRRARRVKRRYQRQQNSGGGGSSSGPHYADSDSDSDADSEDGGHEASAGDEEQGGANGHADRACGMSAKARLLP